MKKVDNMRSRLVRKHVHTLVKTMCRRRTVVNERESVSAMAKTYVVPIAVQRIMRTGQSTDMAHIV